MKFSQFSKFWSESTKSWLETASLPNPNNAEQVLFVSDICTIKKEYSRVMHHNYEAIKKIVKTNYFDSEAKTSLSRYKRAAVIIYATIKSDPIDYNDKNLDINLYLLKQRLAVFLALNSILVDYDEKKVMDKLNEERKANPYVSIFGTEILGKQEPLQDDFLTSFYKDLAFAEIYNNYNVLTTANVLGLIVEKSSILTSDMLVQRDKSLENLTTATITANKD